MLPPKPKKIPKILEAHGDKRFDDYYWLRDDTRQNKEIISYLEEENTYAETWFSEGKDYRKEVFEELVSFIPEEETSLKIKKNGFYYFSKIKSNDQYPVYYREKNQDVEEILNVNKLAENLDFYQISGISPSPDNKIIAFGEDINGRREFTIKFKSLEENKYINDVLENTSGNITWGNNEYIFYTYKDPNTLISNKVYRHKLGDAQSNDFLVYEEKDDEFNLSISKSRTNKYIYINSGKTESNEIWLIDIENLLENPECVLRRSDKHLYNVEDTPEGFFALSNKDERINFCLLKFKESDFENFSNWEVLIEHNEKRLLEDFICFQDFLFLDIREDGLPKILKLNRENLSKDYIDFPDPSYSCYISSNPEYESNEFLFGYTSLRKPSSVYSLNFKTNERKEIWKSQINNFNEDLYETKRIKIESRDGKLVPNSLVYKKDIDLKKAPLLMYGYGSYGSIIDASFRRTIIPLLNKGFIFCISHIRGGSEMGRQWYEDGKMLNKKNTFFDFIDSTKSLLSKDIGNPAKVFAFGGSAGGLLMGAIINYEPELYKGIISAVPFVDVLTTMSDESIPLTTFEYKEWGNPINKEEYEYIKSYSPYDNIEKKNYPTVFVTSSLFDSQVQYFEPAKYVPKLRENSTSKNPILLKMNLIGGHSGKSGRLNALEESAQDNAFFLKLID
ncbi:MAG: S9 family peptidase [Pseudomonadota bacterium]|nr:S9 family peptidase [Pseudomonadota bacterium]